MRLQTVVESVIICRVRLGRRPRGYRGPDRRASLATAGHGGYRGTDRRTRTHSLIPSLGVRGPVASALVLAGLIAFSGTDSWRALSVFALLRTASGLLLLLAGVGQLLVWRLSGRAAPALSGMGFVICGGLMLPLRATAFLLHTDPLLQQIAPGTVVVLGTAGAYLCILSTRSRSVVATLRPSRKAGALAFVAVVALASLGIVHAAVGPLDEAWPWSVGLALVAAGWLAVAGCYLRAVSDDPSLRALAATAAGLSFGDAILAWSVFGHPAVAATAMAVHTVAASWALVVSFAMVEQCLGQQGNRTLRLAGELGDTAQVLAQEQAARHQMLHDARSTLAAIRLANGTLTRYQEELDEMLQADLREAVGSELVRLEEMLSHNHGRERTEFDLAETLAPVIRMARGAGLPVSAHLTGLPAVFGRPVDTATVVQALLNNAARHAGDGPVEVTARVATTAVQVLVSDRGPGIDPGMHETIFQRGFRGQTHEGRAGPGLGLFIARWLMDEQEGSLQVEDRPGGGACFVATVPLSSSRSPDDPGPGERGLPRDLSGLRTGG